MIILILNSMWMFVVTGQTGDNSKVGDSSLLESSSMGFFFNLLPSITVENLRQNLIVNRRNVSLKSHEGQQIVSFHFF